MVGDLNCRHTNWRCHVNNPNGIQTTNIHLKRSLCSVCAPEDPIDFPMDSNRQPDIF